MICICASNHDLVYFSIHFLSQRTPLFLSFFFNDPPTTEIYTLSLHDALPICLGTQAFDFAATTKQHIRNCHKASKDRKSTRLNSSHANISYAVFCLKKKKKKDWRTTIVST